MQKLIKWLDGKKVIISGSILSIYMLLSTLGVHTPDLSEGDIAAWIDKIIILLNGVLWVIGWVHKAIKFLKKFINRK